MNFSPDQIDDVRARADCADLAQTFGARLRRSGGRFLGSCPICGGGKTATRFEADRAKWVCAVCPDGGDAIKLVQKATGRGFVEAVAYLGGVRELTQGERDKIARERATREAQDAKRQEAYRAREIETCRAIWRTAAVGDLADVLDYLRARGLDAPDPFFGRAAAVMPYFHGETQDEFGRRSPRVIHRGPAMLFPLVSPAGAFAGLHVTWFDPQRPGKKAAIVDPDDADTALPAKKMRGSAKGAHLRLARCVEPRRLFLGEGVETVLSARTFLARAGRLRPTDAFWAAGSLGNIGGPHAGTVPHPELKTQAGRPQRVAGPEPAEGPSIVLPDGLDELVLLGDGDSDPFTTAQALARARNRYAARAKVRTVMAAVGADFNDMLMEAAA